MDKISLKAQERTILGKKVKSLRKAGLVPGHVYGKKTETEHVTVDRKDFIQVLKQAGETGVIDLRIGDEKIKPVMVRGAQLHPLTGELLHIDFYQVNLKEKVTVPVPVILVGEELEIVKLGEAVVLQTLSEVSVEALPTDLIESIEVNTEVLKTIGDAITVSQLNYDREKLTVLTNGDEVVVKLDNAVTEEMKKLLEEQEAEAEAVAAESEEGTEEVKEEGEEGESGGDESAESEEGASEENKKSEQNPEENS